MRSILLAAIIAAGLSGWPASGLPASSQTKRAGAAANDPPYFPRTRRTTTTTTFQYDDDGNCLGAVTKITLVTKAIDHERDRLKYSWKASNGKIRGNGPTAVWTRALRDGEVASGIVNVTVSDGHGGKATAKFVFD